MFKTLFIIFILSYSLFASSLSYTIKLAVYHNLNDLKSNIAKLPLPLQKIVQITKYHSLHKAIVIPTKNYHYLKTILPAYQNIFHDAFIASLKSDTKNISQKKSTVTTPPSLKKIFRYQILYLCYDTLSPQKKNILFKVVFKKTDLSFYSILGNTPSLAAQFRTKENKLFIYQKKIYDATIYSILEKITPTYYLVTSWRNGKKVSLLRYYHRQEEALKYMKKK